MNLENVRHKILESVEIPMYNSVRNSVWNSVLISVEYSVWNSVLDSVGNSVGGGLQLPIRQERAGNA